MWFILGPAHIAKNKNPYSNYSMLYYVADIYHAEQRENERNQQRLRLIFANGIQSNMLIRSLATAQYKYENSYQLIITDLDWMNDELAKKLGDERQPI